MPKETFFNLDQEKRDKIMDVIIDEFAIHDYKSASVSKICEAAGIAKGSFYQYFVNKKDLYSYILAHIAESKMAYFAKYQTQLDMSDTFDFLRMMYAMGIDFTYNNPKLYQISKFFMSLPESKRKEFLGDQMDQSSDYLTDMFIAGQTAGTIRKELDVKILVRMLTDMSNSISEYYMFELNKDEVEKDTFLKIANNMMDILEKGIGVK